MKTSLNREGHRFNKLSAFNNSHRALNLGNQCVKLLKALTPVKDKLKESALLNSEHGQVHH
jgi:hypothetical protein